MTDMQISRLSPALGAEVAGINWDGDVAQDLVDRLKDAFLEHQLLCLRAPILPPVDFAKVSRWFGEPQLQLIRNGRQDEAPEVSRMETTYLRSEDKPADVSLVRLTGWHTDDSYFQTPAKTTLLQAIELPSSGGETRFANTQMAFDELDVNMQRRLKSLTAVHLYNTARAKAPPKELKAVEQAETHEAHHPLVRRHEETGRQAIYFNSNRTDRVAGMAKDKSDSLLDELHAHMIQAKYQYHHVWRTGDILIWDNRNLIHSVNMDFPVGEKRVHQRVLLTGTEAVN